MRNIRLDIEYDGTGFVGWQRQRNGRSVQQELEEALVRVTRHPSDVIGAGRTDSGVHARGQVANTMTPSVMTDRELFRALNGVLPDDIAVRAVTEVPESFSARYSATAREYRYVILTLPSALERRFGWECRFALDIDMMNGISRTILGIHDFTSFCKAEAEVDHHRCEVLAAEWTALEGKTVFIIRANRFLHGMVRALVGTMVDIGRGHLAASAFPEIVAAKDRSAAGPAAPPQGLFLERVFY
ncbi:MAG: tRNA pseudouridine(38-40) synthase TruA [Bacteroidetes bacterium]|nr:MAG: tRNA pseudouridine(38-40) synthase TruA [Bacteroidota bacterium]